MRFRSKIYADLCGFQEKVACYYFKRKCLTFEFLI
jgi:hypothetical protein